MACQTNNVFLCLAFLLTTKMVCSPQSVILLHTKLLPLRVLSIMNQTILVSRRLVMIMCNI